MRSMLYRVLLLCLVTGAGACAVQQHTHSLVSGGLLEDAMLAQVEGGGGCTRIERVVQTPTPFFPRVQFVTGHCLNEHADELHSTVGVDSSGVIYSVRTTEGLRFLTRRHPPVGLTRQSIGKFSSWVLQVLDALPAQCRLDQAQHTLSLSASEPDQLWAEFGDLVVEVSVACGAKHVTREVHVLRDGLVEVL